MKKIIPILIIALFLSFGCKKDKSKAENSEIKKYAKYAVAVFKDENLSKRKTYISKAEFVIFLETKTIKIKNKDKKISRVKLSTDETVYIEDKHLADKPIVFIADTKCHMRNNTGSTVIATIPAGTIAFIIAEKANWTKIFAGKIGGKWISDRWVNGGYEINEELTQDAIAYEKALKIMDKKPDAANKIFSDLKGKDNIFSKLVSKLFDNNASEEEGGVDEDNDNSAEDNSKSKDENMAVVSSSSGLRIRDKPDPETGVKIGVIPFGTHVKVLETTGEKQTISGATGKWTKVEWDSKTGWVFGGFLK